MPIHTVLGPIAPADLGLTSMHEHLLLDASVLFVPPDEEPPHGDRVCIENLGFLHWNNQGLLDNLIVDDRDLVVRGLDEFARAGGSAIVDMTNVGLGRRVRELPALARRTGVHILVGCGWYLHATHPPETWDATADQLAQILVDELTDGIEETGVRPALVGEIGTSAPVTARERKMLTAAAWAAVETGAAVNVHVEPGGAHGVEVASLLVGEGVAPDRIVLSHMDERLDLNYHLAIADTGVILEFDTFGTEAYWRKPLKDPTDDERFTQLAELTARGLTDQLVLGCDVFTKTCHTAYGGQGYVHLLRRVVPMLREHYGISPAQVQRMLVDTPRRLLDRPAPDRPGRL